MHVLTLTDGSDFYRRYHYLSEPTPRSWRKLIFPWINFSAYIYYFNKFFYFCQNNFRGFIPFRYSHLTLRHFLALSGNRVSSGCGS